MSVSTMWRHQVREQGLRECAKVTAEVVVSWRSIPRHVSKGKQITRDQIVACGDTLL